MIKDVEKQLEQLKSHYRVDQFVKFAQPVA
jgi:hypothetical protein